MRTEQQCQQIAKEILDIVRLCGQWDIQAPGGTHERLRVLSIRIREQRLDFILLLKITNMVERFEQWVHDDYPTSGSRKDFFEKIDICKLLSQRDVLHRQSLRITSFDCGAMGKPPGPSSVCHSDASNLSSTESSMGIMTPTEDWSDFGSDNGSEIGSDTTETGRTPSITRHSLQLCCFETTKFLRSINEIQEQFGNAPGSPSVSQDDIQFLHKAYGDLVVRLLHGLDAPVPFQEERQPPPGVTRSAVPEVQGGEEDVDVDKELEAIIRGMQETPTQQDITKLAFHWTTLNQANGFRREDVMEA